MGLLTELSASPLFDITKKYPLLYLLDYEHPSVYIKIAGQGDSVDLDEWLAAGKKLYEFLCGYCHAPELPTSEEWPGPDLEGIHRRHSRSWLMDFTLNSRQLPAAVDSLPPRERLENRPIYEHRFEYDFQLEMIYDYLQSK